jgi:hypothetical protein
VGNRIIKQPDGKYAVFSSGTDTIIFWDATYDEIVEFFVQRAVEVATRDVKQVLDRVAADEPLPYYQFTMTWEEALEQDREGGGEAWKEYHRG